MEKDDSELTPEQIQKLERAFLNYVREMKDSPSILKKAKTVLKTLPKGKERDNLIKVIQKVKHNLQEVDVLCQSIELNRLYKELGGKE